jgi:spectinomycin phosphotransferase
VRTPPVDLSESTLRTTLERGWSLPVQTLVYRPVGFGSHHWELFDTSGIRWFVTVDDLRTRRLAAGEPLTAGFARLRASLAAAQALRATGLAVVVAPLPTHDGEPLVRLGDCFTASVYPFVDGESFDWDNYTLEHRHAVLDLLIAVHTAPPQVRDQALIDDYAIPFRDVATAVLTDGHGEPDLGPYARPTVELLTTHAVGVHQALARYDELVRGARADPPGMVLTHGEPHPGNTMRTEGGWLLIDWDTALVAPPERDLWDLDSGDGTVYAAYAAATGIRLRPDLLALYRIRWDLTEIASCIAHFNEPHARTADDEETWSILADLIPTMLSRSTQSSTPSETISVT